MSKRFAKVTALCAGLLTILATIASASACWFYFYQPVEPKALRKE